MQKRKSVYDLPNTICEKCRRQGPIVTPDREIVTPDREIVTPAREVVTSDPDLMKKVFSNLSSKDSHGSSRASSFFERLADEAHKVPCEELNINGAQEYYTSLSGSSCPSFTTVKNMRTKGKQCCVLNIGSDRQMYLKKTFNIPEQIAEDIVKKYRSMRDIGLICSILHDIMGRKRLIRRVNRDIIRSDSEDSEEEYDSKEESDSEEESDLKRECDWDFQQVASFVLADGINTHAQLLVYLQLTNRRMTHDMMLNDAYLLREIMMDEEVDISVLPDLYDRKALGFYAIKWLRKLFNGFKRDPITGTDILPLVDKIQRKEIALYKLCDWGEYTGFNRVHFINISLFDRWMEEN